MNYYIIIRGPAGVGKTTIAKTLAKRLNVRVIHFDDVMRKNKLDKVVGRSISSRNYIRGNEMAIKKARRFLDRGKPVIFDGCFYHKSQLLHLIKNLPYEHRVFTLKASLKECIARDKMRRSRIGEESVKAVYRLNSRLDFGVIVDTSNRTEKETVAEILFHLPQN